MPVSLLAGLIEQNNKSEVALYDYHGTLFNGGARVVVYKNHVIGEATWRFNPVALLDTAAIWDLKLLDQQKEIAEVSAGANVFGEIILKDLNLDLQIHKLRPLLPQEVQSIDATVKVNLSEINIVPKSSFAVAGAVLVNKLKLSQNKPPLGSLVATFNQEEAGSKILVKHSGKGMADVNVLSAIDATGKFTTKGKVQLKQNKGVAVLKAFLSWIGIHKGQNLFEINQKGNIWSFIPK